VYVSFSVNNFQAKIFTSSLPSRLNARIGGLCFSRKTLHCRQIDGPRKGATIANLHIQDQKVLFQIAEARISRGDRLALARGLRVALECFSVAQAGLVSVKVSKPFRFFVSFPTFEVDRPDWFPAISQMLGVLPATHGQ